MPPDSISPEFARLNVTWSGQNGDLPDPVSVDIGDDDIRRVASEAVGSGGIPGISSAMADFTDFVVDRFPATADRPFNAIFLRPKVPFGR